MGWQETREGAQEYRPKYVHCLGLLADEVYSTFQILYDKDMPCSVKPFHFDEHVDAFASPPIFIGDVECLEFPRDAFSVKTAETSFLGADCLE